MGWFMLVLSIIFKIFKKKPELIVLLIIGVLMLIGLIYIKILKYEIQHYKTTINSLHKKVEVLESNIKETNKLIEQQSEILENYKYLQIKLEKLNAEYTLTNTKIGELVDKYEKVFKIVKEKDDEDGGEEKNCLIISEDLIKENGKLIEEYNRLLQSDIYKDQNDENNNSR